MPDQDVVWNLTAKTWARASLSFEFCKGKEGKKKKVLGDPNMDVDVDVDQRPKVADNRVNSISEARPPAKQQKKIVIPAIISTSLLHSSLRVKNAPKGWKLIYLVRIVIPIWMACSISVILYNSASFSPVLVKKYHICTLEDVTDD